MVKRGEVALEGVMEGAAPALCSGLASGTGRQLPQNKTRWPAVGPRLGQRRRPWANVWPSYTVNPVVDPGRPSISRRMGNLGLL